MYNCPEGSTQNRFSLLVAQKQFQYFISIFLPRSLRWDATPPKHIWGTAGQVFHESVCRRVSHWRAGKEERRQAFSGSAITALTAGAPSVELMKNEAVVMRHRSQAPQGGRTWHREAGGEVFLRLPGGTDLGFGVVRIRSWKYLEMARHQPCGKASLRQSGMIGIFVWAHENHR